MLIPIYVYVCLVSSVYFSYNIYYIGVYTIYQYGFD